MPSELTVSIHLKAMNGGGSQSQLIQASNGKKYVIKLIGNPQKTRILANEFVVGRLAQALDVPSPAIDVVNVEQSFVDVINSQRNHHFQAGPAFASLYIESDTTKKIIPSNHADMASTRNVSKWTNAIVLDTLVQNEDLKPEHVLISKNLSNDYSEFFHIDHGHCLGIDRGWSTLQSNASIRAKLYPELVCGPNPFGDAFQKLEQITPEVVDKILNEAPLSSWQVPDSDIALLRTYIITVKASVQNAIINAKPQFRNWT
ncbi:MAG: phosphatidylinositol 4-kinase [Thaumarchaeota archaeon]|nr:phosphatidylinositol 4-kinase [Nitrososphaerota archaeon]